MVDRFSDRIVSEYTRPGKKRGQQTLKTIIIYNSKTGFTKRYADWLAEELCCGVHPYKGFAKSSIEANDIIIFCSRVHAGKIEHLKDVKQHFNTQSKQSLIVVATGATPAAVVDAIKKIWANNFTDTEIKSIPHFYLQSGLNYEKMGFVDRIIMKTVSRLMQRKKDKNEEEAGFEQAIRHSYDISSKEYIMPVVTFVRNKISQG